MACATKKSSGILGQTEAILGCCDFLRDWGRKPANLQFVRCATGRSGQLKTLKAQYAVSGKEAKGVERELIQKFKMKPLVFRCCGWEPEGPEGFYIDNLQNQYQISMSSGETLEKKWEAIETFQVTVEKFLEQP